MQATSPPHVKQHQVVEARHQHGGVVNDEVAAVLLLPVMAQVQHKSALARGARGAVGVGVQEVARHVLGRKQRFHIVDGQPSDGGHQLQEALTATQIKELLKSGVGHIGGLLHGAREAVVQVFAGALGGFCPVVHHGGRVLGYVLHVLRAHSTAVLTGVEPLLVGHQVAQQVVAHAVCHNVKQEAVHHAPAVLLKVQPGRLHLFRGALEELDIGAVGVERHVFYYNYPFVKCTQTHFNKTTAKKIK